jgi:hypothetical protein
VRQIFPDAIRLNFRENTIGFSFKSQIFKEGFPDSGKADQRKRKKAIWNSGLMLRQKQTALKRRFSPSDSLMGKTQEG